MADRLVDSDVLIDALRGQASVKAALTTLAMDGTLSTTVISLYELDCGADTPEERAAIRRLLEGVDIIVLDATSAVEAAKLDRELRQLGRRLEVRDTLIAGIALSHNLPLVTRNRKHFDRVPGLIMEKL